jgi:hypothetical protein
MERLRSLWLILIIAPQNPETEASANDIASLQKLR